VEGGSTVLRSFTNLVFATVQFLSIVRKMSEAKIHVSLEQGIIITFLMKEGCKPLESVKD
jgi:hypothetical protein